MLTRGTLYGFLAFATALVSDQITKAAVLQRAEGIGWNLPVTDFMNLVLVFNRGFM